MKRLLAFALFGAILSASALCADQTAEFKKFQKQFLPKLEKAFRNKDMKFFDMISTPDFKEIMMGKTFTREQAMAQMKQEMASVKSVRAKFKLLTCKAADGTGVETTSGHFVMIMGPMKRGDKNHTMVADMEQKGTWVKSGKTWKIKLLEESKPGKMTMDGKPYDPSKMGGGGSGK